MLIEINILVSIKWDGMWIAEPIEIIIIIII